MKRKLSIILLLSMLATSTLASCSQSDDVDTADTTSNTVTETSVTETSDPLADDLPETDWDGKTFRFYFFNDVKSAFYSDAMDGDVINDAIYTSVNNVIDRFNANIKTSEFDVTPNSSDNDISRIILAGDDEFDAVAGHDRTMAGFSLSNMLLNLNDLDYIDTTKPWWPEHAVRSMTIGGKMFLAASSMSTSIGGSCATYFNKTRLRDYSIDEPYKDVLNGDWTLDMLISLAKDIYEDTNGNSQRDDEDFYGFVAQLNAYMIHESFGLQAYVPDDDEILKLDIDKPETYEFIDKYYSLLFESQGGLMPGDDGMVNTAFKNNQAMFVFSSLGSAVNIYRYADVEYGILPMPKLNESWDTYMSGTNCSPTGVPITVKDTDFVGFMLEALSAEGHRVILPAYFEVALKQKFTQDSESVQMLDIIVETRNIDLGYLYCGALPLCRIIPYMFNPSNPSKDFASFYAKNKDAEQANIDAIIEAYGF